MKYVLFNWYASVRFIIILPRAGDRILLKLVFIDALNDYIAFKMNGLFSIILYQIVICCQI